MRPDTGSAAGMLLALLLVATPTVALGGPETPQQEVEGRLMCYCGCTDLTVRVCTCGTADAIRQEIAARLSGGETPDQVVDAYVARHGAQIRSAPSKAGFELLAWVTPFAAILLAGSALIVIVRRWGARPVADGASSASRGDAPRPFLPEEQETLERLRREMREER